MGTSARLMLRLRATRSMVSMFSLLVFIGTFDGHAMHACVKNANIERIAKLVKIVGMLLQAMVYLFWSKSLEVKYS